MHTSQFGRKRRIENGGVFVTVTADTTGLGSDPHCGLGAYADATGTAHFSIGSCNSPEANTYRPVVDIDVVAGVVRILGVVLVVP
jgi:hypothetical protein